MNGKNIKQSAGYFREKAVLGLNSVNGDDLEKSIVKCTSHMLKAPKEKYMQRLLAASYGHCKKGTKNGRPICEYIVRELEKRSHSHNWIVVLKSLVVLHRLITDGSDEILRYICQYKHIFSFGNMKELRSSKEGYNQSEFMFQYMGYLQSRCVMQIELGDFRRIETAEFDEYYSSLNVDSLYPVFQTLLQPLAVISHMRYNEFAVNNFCTYEAHQMLISDAKNIFQLLSKSILFILNGFSEFKLPQKRSWLTNYRSYDQVFRQLKILFDSMLASQKVFTESIPQLKPLPDSLLARLEQDVEKNDVPNEVVSLESLGITSSSAEKKSDWVPDLSSKKTTEPPPRTETKAPQQMKPTPELPKPTFRMEDLFEPAPIQQAAPKQQFDLFEQMAMASEQGQGQVESPTSWSTGAPQPLNNSNDMWGSGAPQGWSTGAPQQWPANGGGGVLANEGAQNFQTQPQAQQYVYQPQQPQIQSQLPSNQQSLSNQPPQGGVGKKNTEDPFKSLFEQGKNQF